MENVLRPIYQEKASQPNTLGVLIYEKHQDQSPVTDNFDVILLIVSRNSDDEWFVKHYEFENKTAAMHIVDEDLLNEWIRTSGYRKVIDWLINGKIVFDRNEYLSNLKEKLREFPEHNRKLKKAIEFAKLIRAYRECKDLFHSKHYLDANSLMIRSLHYLARVTVLEKGFHPEITVWNQVKRIDPEVYKLYEELMESNEPTDKRISLMLLASDFAIHSRAEQGAEHLLDIMKEKDEPWSFSELKVHPETQHYTLDLSILLEYLVERKIIDIELVETKGKNIYHRKYTVKED
ncbi:nucleotidyltransferase-like protein [Aquisalibacillus elongatus]|uniref:Nucleotidyltransferase-like protein n=1 Tax=Aquisalibacillus elongatus TaxID=485577 RepID=A0A3N5AZZ1_9BACI|nr:nucleotidyltransferase-like protein [Aquisalibacillus elongatus]RPF50533.1 nucleotidyltransferase-like protein [Aquisalibacillus elongatus]